MKVSFERDGWADYVYWQTSESKTLRRINELIREAQRTPFEGIGKPEPLKHDYAGYWSRRIDLENRLVYRVVDDTLVIIQCRGHY